MTAQQGSDGLGPNGKASAGWASASISSVRPEQKTEPVEGFVSKGFGKAQPTWRGFDKLSRNGWRVATGQTGL